MTLSPADELRQFKTNVNLVAYAAGAGYEVDRKKSSRSSVSMRHPAGDKIVISRQNDGHWVYFSVRDSSDRGTIIDFIQHRTRLNLGEIRKLLRDWTGMPSPFGTTPTASPAPASASARRLEHSAFVDLSAPIRDPSAVRGRLLAMTPVTDGVHSYLNTERRLPASVLQMMRFRGTFRTDLHDNAVFPHHQSPQPNDDAVCGYEVKAPGHTRFATGGIKGLWLSNGSERDVRLVIGESAIDAISYAVLWGSDRTRFASVSGGMNDRQPGLIRDAANALPAGASLVAAFDNDEGGDRLLEALRAALPEVRILAHRPLIRGQDWNDVLRESRGVAETRLRTTPSKPAEPATADKPLGPFLD